MTREEILNAAKEAVGGNRSGYGELEDNFELLMKLWGVYNDGKKHRREPKDAAVVMILLKIARIATGEPNADNWVDIAGYAACGGELEGKSENS